MSSSRPPRYQRRAAARVSYFSQGARTHSLVVRGLTGTVREVIATHRLDKLDRISAIDY